MITKYISTTNLEKLKQQARKLKREQAISHTEALDRVAKSFKFNHWHDVVMANDRTKPTEDALRNGYLLAFDFKESIDVEKGLLIQDSYAKELIRAELFDIFLSTNDPDDPEQRQFNDSLSENEYDEVFRDSWDFVYFRLNPTFDHKSLDEVFESISKYSFWMPWMVWYKGDLVYSIMQ